MPGMHMCSCCIPACSHFYRPLSSPFTDQRGPAPWFAFQLIHHTFKRPISLAV